MSPDIPKNSFLLFHHFIRKRQLRVGTLVRVKHPVYGMIIKRIVTIDKTQYYWLKGDNKKSVSTSEMGPVTIEMITGIVCYKIS